MAWHDQLQQASWRGIAFDVEDVERFRTPNLVIHEYPNRDSQTFEHMGRGVERIRFRAYMIGEFCIENAQRLAEAMEDGEPGELVHPFLGAMRCRLFHMGDSLRRGEGRAVEMNLEFVVDNSTDTGAWPSAEASPLDNLIASALDVDVSEVQSFYRDVTDGIQSAQSTVRGVLSTTQSYVDQVQAVVGGASRAVNTIAGVGSLVGGNVSFGRYSMGNIGTLSTVTQGLAGVSTALSTVQRTNNAVSTLVRSASTAHSLVDRAISTTTTLAGNLL